MFIGLTVLMIVAWLALIGSVLLMAPKGWIWFGLGWAAGIWSNEYGSKKSLETTLKKVAIVAAIIFVLCVFFLPYVQSH